MSEITVVLVHGAFADASSWNGVINQLQAKGVSGDGAREPTARNRRRLGVHRSACFEQIEDRCWPWATPTAGP